MAEGLEYRFKEETKRGAPLEIIAPIALVDGATDLSDGFLLQERQSSREQKRRVFGERRDGQGNVLLDFDLNTNGLIYFEGPARERSSRTLDIIGQLDRFARGQGLSDPRISVDVAARRSTLRGATIERGAFDVSFERPEGSLEELVQKIQSRMAHAAKALHVYDSRFPGALATLTDEGGIELRIGKFWAEHLVLATEAPIQQTESRVELAGNMISSDEVRLAALLGIIGALDPPAA